MSSSPPCPLLSLPPEIIFLIANYISRRGWACLARTCRTMDGLLRTKLDLYFEKNNYRPMLWAARYNRPHTLERGLLIRAANPNPNPGPDHEGWSNFQAILLHEAISNRSRDAVRILLDKGVDPNKSVKDSKMPPLTAAVRKGDIQIARMLLMAGADVDYRPPEGGGWVAAAQARWDENDDMLALLMSFGAEVPYEGDSYASCTDEDHQSNTSGEIYPII